MIQDKGALFKGDSVEEGPKLQLSALNTRRASGLRARYAPRLPEALSFLIVLDRWGHRRSLLLLALTTPSTLGCRWLRIHIHPSPVRVCALPTHHGIDRGFHRH
jgi:hypothetical protein